MNDKEAEVYKDIKKHKPAKQSEIVKRTGLDPSVVHYALKYLQACGKVDYFPARFEIRGEKK